MEAVLLELLQQAKEAGSSASLSFTEDGDPPPPPEEEEEMESLCSIWHCFLSVRYTNESTKYPYMTDLSASHPDISVITYR